MSTARPLRHRLAVLAIAPLAVALVACGSDDEGDAGPSDAVTVTETPEDTASSSGTPTDATTTGGSGNGPAEGALEAAAQTALDEVDGTLVTIDLENDGGWDVTVLTGDLVEQDLDISADGSTVERGPTSDDDDNDNDDRAERQQQLDAQVDYLAAIEAARGEIGDLQVTGADLGEDDGVLRWDVDFGDDTDDDQQTAFVDAASGDVSGSERDDNDGDDDGDDGNDGDDNDRDDNDRDDSDD